MKSSLSLIKRNCKIFYRTKGNIFFATLSVIILVVLHFIIFRNMFTDSWLEIVSKMNILVEKEKIQWLVDNLMFSAILPIGAITISLVTLGLMVSDKETNALNDFLVSPIKRNQLLVSYLVSSFIVGFIILLGFVAFFEIYFLIVFGFGFSLIQFLLIILLIMGLLIFANVFMLFLISFVKSQQSLGAIGTILGTLLGFISGAYIPVGQFGTVISNFFSCLPFLQLTVIFRRVFLIDISNHTPLTLDMISGKLGREFGIELWIGNNNISIPYILISVALITIILLIGLLIKFQRMKKDN